MVQHDGNMVIYPPDDLAPPGDIDMGRALFDLKRNREEREYNQRYRNIKKKRR